MGLDEVKNLCSSLKTCYRSVSNHPLILALVFALILLYKFLPSVITFFISSSPILVCTAVLLRTFLNFGSQETTRIESRRTVRARLIDDDTVIANKDASLFSSEGRSSRKRWEIKGRTPSSINIKRKVAFSPTHDPRVEENDTQMDNNIERQVSQGSYPEASPRETMIEELDDMRPLLESKPVASAGCEVASDDTERSIDGSVDSEEVDNHEEEEEKVGEEEEDGNKSVVTWTEDDQKNLMDLGTSELERNQRLENLIAKRRARKSFNRLHEEDLIDLDSTTDPPPFHLSNISTIKTNPFDIPYDSSAHEIEGLPPIPGSAPSIMAPRRNPFDLPYDPLEERPNLTGDSFHQEFMSILQKDMFCRHESFSLGNSFSGVTKFSSYFTNVGTALQETGYPTIQDQQLRAKSKSSKQLPPVSKIGAQGEESKEPKEEDLIQQDENPSINNSFDSNEQEKQNPEPVVDDLMKTIQEDKADHVGIENADNEEQQKDLSLPPTSPSSSQMNDKNIESEVSTTTENSDAKINAENGVVEEPLYDSSPSAVEKRTIDEPLFCIDKEVPLASTSMASDMVVEVSELGSPQLERTISYPVDTMNHNGETQIGSANNDEIEENGWQPREVIEIECGIKDEFLGDKHESKDLKAASIEEESEAKPALVDSK